MKLAYLVQSHTEPLQVDRLVRSLLERDPEALVLVSHDRAGPPLLEATTSNARVYTSYDEGGRGRFHNVARWLDAVSWLSENHPVDFVITLTGQDYPIRPPAEFHEALRRSGDGLVEHFPALANSSWRPGEGRTRYLFSWTDVATLRPSWSRRLRPVHALNHLQPFMRVNVSYGALRMGRRRIRQPFDQNFAVWGGSFFTNLSWRSVQHVRAVVSARPEIVQWGRRSLLAEEGFLQSILLSSTCLRFENTSGRFYDFQGGRDGSPAVLSRGDVSRAFASRAFFARKWGRDFPDAYAAIDAAIDRDGSLS